MFSILNLSKSSKDLQIFPMSLLLLSSNLITLLLEIVELSQVTLVQVQQFEVEVFHPTDIDSIQLEKLTKALRSFELHITA